MKIFFNLLSIALLGVFTACSSVQEIGNLTQASTKNMDANAGYVSLSTATPLSKRETKKEATAKSIEDAITVAANKYPGGVFMQNLRIYYVTRLIRANAFLVTGDVWGTPSGDFSGFKVGDTALYQKKGKGKAVSVTIVAFKDNTEAMVKKEGSEKIFSVPMGDLAHTK